MRKTERRGLLQCCIACFYLRNSVYNQQSAVDLLWGVGEVEEAVTVAVVVVEGGEAGLEGREVLVLQQENDLVTCRTLDSLLDDGRQLGHWHLLVDQPLHLNDISVKVSKIASQFYLLCRYPADSSQFCASQWPSGSFWDIFSWLAPPPWISPRRWPGLGMLTRWGSSWRD